MKKTLGTTRKLLTAIVALVAALGIATGATYAWFTANRQVTIQPVTVNVTSGDDNLLIAVTAEGNAQPAANLFKAAVVSSTVTEAINAAVSGTLNTISLDALTSNDNGANLRNKPVDSGTPGSTVDKNSGRYATFDIWLKATSASSAHPITVKMGGKSGNYVSSAGISASYVPAIQSVTASNYTNDSSAGDIAAATGIPAKAANAVRIAFIPASGGIAKVWCPNEAAKNGAAFNSGTGQLDTAEGWYKNNLASDYNTAVNGSEAVTQQSYSSYIVVAENSVDTEADLVTLTSDTPVRVTVKIWLEGTDGDCFNSVYNDHITVSLQFVI